MYVGVCVTVSGGPVTQDKHRRRVGVAIVSYGCKTEPRNIGTVSALGVLWLWAGIRKSPREVDT
ncbi:LOG family protein PA4923 [Anopheles sinensis]|uniref:LOG family protein PA4923 n=1 Tax=Anopheles sinensis TaxID=74873 RepID=A0A084WLW5_ANOSI|nr:LOG family protein PA4923 [Anopheles sinensis]